MLIPFLISAVATSDPNKLINNTLLSDFEAECICEYPNNEDKTLEQIQYNIVLSGHKYHITFEDKEIISDGIKVWNYNHDENQVIVSKVNKEDLIFLLKNYKKHFNIEVHSVDSLTHFILRWKKENDHDIEHLELLYDKDVINKITIYNKENSWMRFVFQSFNKKSQKIKDKKYFTLDLQKLKDVEVINNDD